MAEDKESPLLSKWEAVVARFEELNAQLADPSVLSQPPLLRKLTKERADLEEVAQLFSSYQELLRQLAEADYLLRDATAEAELKKLAAEEAAVLQDRRKKWEERALDLLVPKDPRDEKNTFLEIRAGTGGEEAALFAGELFRMYVKYAEK